MKTMSEREMDIRRRATFASFGCDLGADDFPTQRMIAMWDAVHDLIDIINSDRERERVLMKRVDDCRQHCTNAECRTESLRVVIGLWPEPKSE